VCRNPTRSVPLEPERNDKKFVPPGIPEKAPLVSKEKSSVKNMYRGKGTEERRLKRKDENKGTGVGYDIGVGRVKAFGEGRQSGRQSESKWRKVRR